MSTVYFRGGRNQAVLVIRSVLESLTGRGAPSEYAKGVFLSIGFAALSDIQADFVKKARGETGEDGNVWPRLSPKTLAYSRRFGPGEKSALKKAAGLGRAHHLAPGGKDGLLTAAQLKRWRKLFSMHLARLAARYPLAQAKAYAAGIAWNKIKAEGAKTKLEVFGHRAHEALRDTGILLNSLSMGTLSGDTYTKPSLSGGDQQIFEALENGVIVGTSVPYARTHNEGDRRRRIPERRFIPRDGQIPTVWLNRWAETGTQATAVAIAHALSGAA